MKDVYLNKNSDTACRSKRREHLQLGKRLKDVNSNTNSDTARRFEKGRTSSVRKEIEGRIFEYMDSNKILGYV